MPPVDPLPEQGQPLPVVLPPDQQSLRAEHRQQRGPRRTLPEVLPLGRDRLLPEGLRSAPSRPPRTLP